MSSAVTPILRLSGITKQFGDVIANEEVDLALYPGEIHALVGENGAGKTTLMRVLFGIYRADAGTVQLNGKKVQFSGPSDAIESGIGMVHQHFMLVPSFTVAENVVLGAEPGPRGIFSRARSADAIGSVAERLGVTVDPNTVVGDLSVATQQKLEIMKVLYRGARIIILDEPTAVLTPSETTELFALLRRLAKDDGAAVVFISHKLREVFEIADRITVLRQGKSVGSYLASETDTSQVVAAMTGRSDVNLGRVERTHEISNPVLHVRNLETAKTTHDAALGGISFEVKRGEIVGIAGVEGNGQTALAEALVGAIPVRNGSILLHDQDISHRTTAQRRDAGLAFVPEDRQREGIPMGGSVLEGLAPGKVRRSGRGGWWKQALGDSVRRWAKTMVADHDIRTNSIDARCSQLSGGNQQKIVVARELDEQPELLVLAQPTRGVDLGAIDFIYGRIAQATAHGCGVLLISADLDELLRLSDRILVMYSGQIVAEEVATLTSRERLGQHMMGLTRGAAG